MAALDAREVCRSDNPCRTMAGGGGSRSPGASSTPVVLPWQDEEATRLCGCALLIAGGLFTSICLYSIVLSKLLPRTGDALLDAIADDYYYCVLVPLTIPVTLIAVYWNWVSMKFFRHN